MKNRMRDKLTLQQEIQICEIIGDWYSDWKRKLVDYGNKGHRLGYAKEELKERICRSPDEWEEIEKKESKNRLNT